MHHLTFTIYNRQFNCRIEISRSMENCLYQSNTESYQPERAGGLLSDIDSSELSKVYEKQVLHQLTDFIETKQVYYTHQSGYCKSHSCLKDLEKDLTPIAKWSIETNLVFSTGKTKFMLITLINCRHDINLKKMSNYRFAAITPN